MKKILFIISLSLISLFTCSTIVFASDVPTASSIFTSEDTLPTLGEDPDEDDDPIVKNNDEEDEDDDVIAADYDTEDPESNNITSSSNTTPSTDELSETGPGLAILLIPGLAGPILFRKNKNKNK